mmetsp:Transcript_7963/g.14031  ORF Transcript_7963/g.14031 Transcript_7963/m.14031 type:complete len:182 (-) Transcript_7963:52-597(-)
MYGPDVPSANSIQVFCANLNKNTSIRRLAFNLCGGEMFTLHMSQFLENNTSLTSLSATNYCLGLEGTRLLSSALARKSSSLKYLDLSSAGIGDEACQELVMALRSGHSQLRSLELNGNTIQNAGCVAIASLLRNPNSMLIRLYVIIIPSVMREQWPWGVVWPQMSQDVIHSWKYGHHIQGV